MIAGDAGELRQQTFTQTPPLPSIQHGYGEFAVIAAGTYRVTRISEKACAYVGDRNSSTGSSAGAMPSAATSGSKFIWAQPTALSRIARVIVRVPALICMRSSGHA